MAVSDITFRTTRELKAAARNANLIEYTTGTTDTGRLFVASYTLDPRVAAVIETQNERVRNRVATGEPATAPVKRVRAVPADGYEGVPRDVLRPVPITKIIRDWTHANPNATKADALAHFPSCNASTVSVQFGKARKGEV
jgi:hypothetical protein